MRNYVNVHKVYHTLFCRATEKYCKANTENGSLVAPYRVALNSIMEMDGGIVKYRAPRP